MPPNSTQFYEFANFRLDPSEKVLLRNGHPVPLTPKVFDTLEILVENTGHLLEKNELMQRLWQDRFVEESNLTSNIKTLRRALGDDASHPRFIETVPRRGYRFIAEVRSLNGSGPSVVEKRSADGLERGRYVLISLVVILMISGFGIAFMWVSENNSLRTDQPKFVRLTTSGKVTNAAVVPDAKSIVYSQKEGEGESLWLRQIDSGSQTQILPPQDGEFVGLTVSPDGKSVYYSFFTENVAVLTLMRVALDGGTPEQISGVETDVSVSFSPDGKKFAFTESHKSIKTTELKVADVDGTNQKVLIKTVGDNRVFPFFRSSPVAWSPDGAKIACAVKETDENGSFSKILLVNPETGGEEILSERTWSEIESVAWKNAENLALIEFEANSPIKRVWQISRKTGEARRLTDDLNGYGWLSSANGTFFALQESVFSSLHIAEFAENADNLPSKQIFGESGRIESVGWSRDERIFFNSSGTGKNEIWQINADGTAPGQLTRDSKLIYTFTVSPVDDSFIFSSLQNGKISLAAADPDGQNIRQITTGVEEMLPAFSPSGTNVVFQAGVSPETLWSIPVGDNQVPAQLTGYHASHPAVSPDGKQIAFHFMDYGSRDPHWKLGLIDNETRKLVNKLEFPITVTDRQMVWHPKNNLLTMTFRSGEDSGIILWSMTDGNVRKLDMIASGIISAFSWSADGSRLAYSQVFKKADVVSLNGF